jgi:hypothetical protein
LHGAPFSIVRRHKEGISIVEYADGKIIGLREYRRTEFPYDGLSK